MSLVKMIAPSASAAASVSAAGGTRPAASKMCVEMARVVSFNGSDASPRASGSITVAPAAFSSSSDAILPRRVSRESAAAVHPDADVAAPIFKSAALSPTTAPAAKTKVAVPSVKGDARPVADASDVNCNLAEDPANLVFQNGSCGSAVHPDSSVAAPISKSEALLPGASAAIIAKVAGPSAESDAKPIINKSGGDASAVKELGSLVFHRSQAGRVAAKRKKGSANSVSGRWTAAEHEGFLKGLKVYGREWKKVARCVPTRTSAQIRSHAQKYFAKVSREQQHLLALTEHRRSSLAGMQSHLGPKSVSFINTMNSMARNPSAVQGRVRNTLTLLRERYKQLQEQLKANKTPTLATGDSQVRLGEVLGPASAALEVERTSLQEAAAARHEAKARETPPHVKEDAGGTTEDANCDARAPVSVTPTPPSHGVFDSSDVIALSRLGGHLGREKFDDKTVGATKDASSLKSIRERPWLVGQECPTKMRKLDVD